MAKKLKITESQLQKLMERKHSYTDNSPEGEVEELVTPLHMWLQDKEQNKSNGSDLKTDIVALLQELGDYMENRADSDDGRQGNEEMHLLSDINDILYKLGAGPDTSGRSMVDASYKPHEGPIEEEDEEEEESNDEMMNESVKSIKANFRRFL